MKKICFICWLALLFSLNVYADGCNIENLDTKAKIENAQSCLIKQLSELDAMLGDVDVYYKQVKDKFERLLVEEAACQQMALRAEHLSNKSSLIPLRQCEELHVKRMEDYSFVVDEYNALNEKVPDLESKRDILKLHGDLIASAYDLLVKGEK
jgi:hypothetical protein